MLPLVSYTLRATSPHHDIRSVAVFNFHVLPPFLLRVFVAGNPSLSHTHCVYLTPIAGYQNQQTHLPHH
ncbi:hypothetical protein L1887_31646 [Cichorium endivia]|nr:hypothetical protein L1887_31646 [Cichorium endivia]